MKVEWDRGSVAVDFLQFSEGKHKQNRCDGDEDDSLEAPNLGKYCGK